MSDTLPESIGPTELTEEQKEYLRQNWDKLDLRELVRNCFDNPKLDGRSKPYAPLVRAFLASNNILVRTASKNGSSPNAPGIIQLTETQKEFIRNNYQDANSVVELAKMAFNKIKLRMGDLETRAVFIYCKEIDPTFNRDEEPVEEMEYKAPVSISHLIARVNRCITNRTDHSEPFYATESKLTPSQEQNLRALMSFMKLPRFLHQGNQYLIKSDRELFEAEFIGFTHDKPDLLREELEQYISLAASIVAEAQLNRNIQRLEEQANIEFMETKKVSMTVVDHLKNLKSSLESEQKSQKDLYKTLTVSRSTRMKTRIEANASLHNLVAAWMKKDDRDKIILLNDKFRKHLKEEVERLSDMDSLKCEIFGLSKDNIQR